VTRTTSLIGISLCGTGISESFHLHGNQKRIGKS
jgi:hypothetical protein